MKLVSLVGCKKYSCIWQSAGWPATCDAGGKEEGGSQEEAGKGVGQEGKEADHEEDAQGKGGREGGLCVVCVCVNLCAADPCVLVRAAVQL